MYGELIPAGGGDPIPLLKTELKFGRRESNDVVLRFPNVSGEHCVLTLENGYWFLTDLDSQNGTKVNGSRILRKRVDPGDHLSIAKHAYEIQYSPTDNGALGGPPPDEDDVRQVMNASLLQRAGLQRRAPEAKKPSSRYDVNDNSAGQMKRPKTSD